MLYKIQKPFTAWLQDLSHFIAICTTINQNDAGLFTVLFSDALDIIEMNLKVFMLFVNGNDNAETVFYKPSSGFHQV